MDTQDVQKKMMPETADVVIKVDFRISAGGEQYKRQPTLIILPGVATDRGKRRYDAGTVGAFSVYLGDVVHAALKGLHAELGARKATFDEREEILHRFTWS